MEFIDLKAQYKTYKEEFDEGIKTVLENAEFIGGRYVNRLEEDLAKYVGRKHCVTCGNGTDALQLAYMAYGINKGDAVFCPDMTFISSVEPAIMLGATPVFCDIEHSSYNIDSVSLRAEINRVKAEGKLNPKFVVAVDFLGNPVNYDELELICKEEELILIEDAAQGMGGEYQGKKLASFGDIATTSFFPSKPLGCYGDGGAVFTDSDEIDSLLRSYRVHGKGSSKYDNVRIGMNSRLDNLQAAILCVKLTHLDEEMDLRQKIAKVYDDAFKDSIQYPVINSGDKSAYAQYVLRSNSAEGRDRIIEKMEEAGIPSLIYYPKAMHQMPAFGMMEQDYYPEAIAYAETNFGLPISAFLDPEDQFKVIKCVLDALDEL